MAWPRRRPVALPAGAGAGRGNLSAAISTALRRYVEIEEGRQEGYDEIIVRVGPGAGRKQRFGVLLGEWGRSTSQRAEDFRVYRTRTGKFVVHIERSAEWATGWRSWVGNWSSQTWGLNPADSILQIANSLDELRDMLPPQLYDMVAEAVDQPTIETSTSETSGPRRPGSWR
jgi:EXLDI family protein